MTSFDQISSDSQVRAKLHDLFGTVDNIDAFVGALAEDHFAGSSVGPLVRAVVANQFERLRDGDRFFYTADPFLRSDAVRQILDLEAVSLSKVIRWNTGGTGLQGNVFFAKLPGDGEQPTRTVPVDAVETKTLIANGQDDSAVVNNVSCVCIGNVWREDDSGVPNPLEITVPPLAVYAQPLTLSFNSEDGSVTAGDGGYVAKTGTLIFAPNEPTKTFTVKVRGDSEREAHEAFYLDLYDESDKSFFTKYRGIGTILDDDWLNGEERG